MSRMERLARMVLLTLLLAASNLSGAADSDPQATSETCQPIQGKIREYRQRKRPMAKGPPRISNVLVAGFAENASKEITAVLVESLGQSHLRFRPVLSSNDVAEPVVELPVECISGQQTHMQTVSIGGGWHGTVIRVASFSLESTGDLLVRVRESATAEISTFSRIAPTRLSSFGSLRTRMAIDVRERAQRDA